MTGIYEKVNEETFEVTQMSSEEIAEKQQAEKDRWNSITDGTGGFASWIFDETTCAFKPPTEHPNDGKSYDWDENTTSWVLTVEEGET